MAQPSKDELLARAEALVPRIAARAMQTDAARHVSEESMAEIKQAGLLNILVPAKLGGIEADFSHFSAVTRRLAMACGSTAWIYAVLAETAWITALYPKQAQDEVWARGADPVICASIVPFGKAAKVGGGWRVSGRWSYLSGSDHANWVLLSAATEPGAIRGNIVDLLVRKSEIDIVDDWRVLGLAGTASNGATVEDLFVPEWRGIPHAALLDGTAPGRDVHSDYALGRVPRNFVVGYSLSPVIVGLASRALELVTEALRQPGAASMPDWVAVQAKFCDATLDIELANLILADYGARNDAILRANRAITAEEIAHARLAASRMVRLAKQGIETLMAISGSRWLYDSNPLQLIFRDASAAATHRSTNWEVASLAYCASLGLGGTKAG